MSQAHNSETDALPPRLAEFLCHVWNLGAPCDVPAVRVTGGLLHRMYDLQTTRGRYAVKRLSARSVATPQLRDRLAQSERFARLAFDYGLPAVAALETNTGPIADINGEAFLVYDWHDGVTLPPAPVSPNRAERIGAFLGRLHGLSFAKEGLPAPAPEAYAEGYWQSLIVRAESQSAEWAGEMRQALPELNAWNAVILNADANLQGGDVVSHRDLDQKNVLWHNGEPGRQPGAETFYVLDWEAAGRVHPALEVMGAGLNWAGQAAGDPVENVFRAFLDGYRQETCLDANALQFAAVAVLGKWLIWLEFNLRRSLEPQLAGTDEYALAVESARHAFSTLRGMVAQTELRQQWSR